MITWAKHLRIGKSVQGRASAIVHAADKGERVLSACLITFAANARDALDIVPAAEVKEMAARGRLPKVVGIAGSKKEAMRLVEDIAKESLQKRGDLNLRAFLEEEDERTGT